VKPTIQNGGVTTSARHSPQLKTSASGEREAVKRTDNILNVITAVALTGAAILLVDIALTLKGTGIIWRG